MNEERSYNTQDIGESSYRQYLDGDKDKFKVLVEYYGANLIYFINGYVKNIFVAEDLMEETFCDLVYYKHRYKGKSSFKTYLFSIARNKAVDYLKSKSKATITSLDDLSGIANDDLNLENMVVRKEEYRHLYSALSKIKYEYRNVLYLFYFEDMSYNEIAKVMKKNNKQIKNLMYRAKQTLKLIMETEGFIYEE